MNKSDHNGKRVGITIAFDPIGPSKKLFLKIELLSNIHFKEKPSINWGSSGSTWHGLIVKPTSTGLDMCPLLRCYYILYNLILLSCSSISFEVSAGHLKAHQWFSSYTNFCNIYFDERYWAVTNLDYIHNRNVSRIGTMVNLQNDLKSFIGYFIFDFIPNLPGNKNK